jgi:excisionase family DNA binding protein
MRLDPSDLEQFRHLIRDEIQTLAATGPPGWLSVKGAASYLDTTDDAIRALVKRKQIPCERAPNGRLLFWRDDLNEWVRSDV